MRLGEQTYMHRYSLQLSILLARLFGILTCAQYSGRCLCACSGEIVRKLKTYCATEKLTEFRGFGGRRGAP